jgi:hypothetical protein
LDIFSDSSVSRPVIMWSMMLRCMEQLVSPNGH